MKLKYIILILCVLSGISVEAQERSMRDDYQIERGHRDKSPKEDANSHERTEGYIDYSPGDNQTRQDETVPTSTETGTPIPPPVWRPRGPKHDGDFEYETHNRD